MGLLIRPSRPVTRLAAGAATANGACEDRKQRAPRDLYDEQASAADVAAPAVPPASPPPPVVTPQWDTTGELERLARLYESGALTDQEFGAAKAQLLGGRSGGRRKEP